MSRTLHACCFLFASLMCGRSIAADPSNTARGDQMIAEYFREETAKLGKSCLSEVQSLEDWKSQRDEYRRQLLEMLGLDPLPEKTDLKATVTGAVDLDELRIENVQFQSRPGLYVTGNLYLPKKIEGRLPAVLYVCGHGGEKKDGVSYGNKTHYRHHGAWFARNGYVCLTIDSLQLGEIEGIHHGTHRFESWWWLNRGYTPAGVEAWNCVRALDYLQCRAEVDPARLGVTGRSGGGAYSWWIAAIDDRIQCAVPVAGITDLQNHVVDGCVEGHCDCMYMLNTYRWDYAKVAALVAPRPLLISNTDTDSIFPLDGVVRVFEQVRRIYALHGAADKVALNITAGGHKDTQELQVHAFRWLNHHLKQDDSLIETTAVPFTGIEPLRVFSSLPTDQLNTTIQETFVPLAAAPALPHDAAAWSKQRDEWMARLRDKAFAGWPKEPESLNVRDVSKSNADGIDRREIEFTSQGAIRLRVVLLNQSGLTRPDMTSLIVLDKPSAAEKEEFIARSRETLVNNKVVLALLEPRGVGQTAWDQSPKKQTQHRRRFYLLGQTLDAMQVWDIRRAIQSLRSQEPFATSPLHVVGSRVMAGNVLYASLFEPNIRQLQLNDLPISHRDGPFYLNSARFLDTPAAVAMAAERSQVSMTSNAPAAAWQYPHDVAEKLGWRSQFQVAPVK